MSLDPVSYSVSVEIMPLMTLQERNLVFLSEHFHAEYSELFWVDIGFPHLEIFVTEHSLVGYLSFPSFQVFQIRFANVVGNYCKQEPSDY